MNVNPEKSALLVPSLLDLVLNPRTWWVSLPIRTIYGAYILHLQVKPLLDCRAPSAFDLLPVLVIENRQIIESTNVLDNFLSTSVSIIMK